MSTEVVAAEELLQAPPPKPEDGSDTSAVAGPTTEETEEVTKEDEEFVRDLLLHYGADLLKKLQDRSEQPLRNIVAEDVKDALVISTSCEYYGKVA